MTAHNCPMCELRFATRTERDWHLSNEHQHLHVHPPANPARRWARHPAPHPEPDADTEPETGSDEKEQR